MPVVEPVTIAVEGLLDEAITVRLIECAGGKAGVVYGKNGKDNLRSRLRGYCNAARHAPWFVLTDMDADASCAPELLDKLLGGRIEHFCFRIAVHEVESWLLADSLNLASFLSVNPVRIEANPDSLFDPKHHLVQLTRYSRKRFIREGLVPRPGSRRTEGDEYTSTMIQFAKMYWSPGNARRNSDSLDRAMSCLEKLLQP
jgi:hypothetical protein